MYRPTPGIDRRGRIRLADAADEHLRRGIVASQRCVVRELQVRHHLVEHVGVEDLPLFERVAGERRDRNRRVLEVLLHLARRDDDLFEALRGLLLCPAVVVTVVASPAPHNAADA